VESINAKGIAIMDNAILVKRNILLYVFVERTKMWLIVLKILMLANHYVQNY